MVRSSTAEGSSRPASTSASNSGRYARTGATAPHRAILLPKSCPRLSCSATCASVSPRATRRSTSTSRAISPSREVEALGMCETEDGPVGTAVASSLLSVPPELVPPSCCGPRPWLRQRPFPPVALGRQLPPVHRWDDRRAARASPELHAELQPFPRAAPPR